MARARREPTTKIRASEVQPLSAEELKTLDALMTRWVLSSFPTHDGSSENSDAYQTYLLVHEDAKRGFVRGKDEEDDDAGDKGITVDQLKQFDGKDEENSICHYE